mmetsp:Transcript_3560/g.8738  ORF Transcript_3560/g.8738 Transcript_3560/m.8738 type:complete len:201 (-) Transcript_3560:186-788(-)
MLVRPVARPGGGGEGMVAGATDPAIFLQHVGLRVAGERHRGRVCAHGVSCRGERSTTICHLWALDRMSDRVPLHAQQTPATAPQRHPCHPPGGCERPRARGRGRHSETAADPAAGETAGAPAGRRGRVPPAVCMLGSRNRAEISGPQRGCRKRRLLLLRPKRGGACEEVRGILPEHARDDRILVRRRVRSFSCQEAGGRR